MQDPEYVSRLEQEARTLRREQEDRIAQDTAAQLATQYEEKYGLSSEQALEFAKEQVKQATEVYRQRQFLIGQVRAAHKIAAQYKVDPEVLINLPSPEAMHQAAKSASEQGQVAAELASLRAEVAKLKMAPPQNFASPAAAPQSGGVPYVETLKAGGALPPAKEIDRYTADWLRRQTG